MGRMERPSFQLSVAGMLGLIACIALNIWLFRFGALLGLVGLNITKHVMIAYLCQVLGVDKRKGTDRPSPFPGSRTRPAGPLIPNGPALRATGPGFSSFRVGAKRPAG